MTTVTKYVGGSGGGFGLSVDAASLPPRCEALAKLSEPVAGAYPRAKRVAQRTVDQVFTNAPLEDYPRVVYGWKRICGDGGEPRQRPVNRMPKQSTGSCAGHFTV